MSLSRLVLPNLVLVALSRLWPEEAPRARAVLSRWLLRMAVPVVRSLRALGPRALVHLARSTCLLVTPPVAALVPF